MKHPGSNLVTPTGLVFLGLLTLVAAYLRAGALEALLIVLLILCLTAYFWSRAALGHIEVELEQEDLRAFPGELVEAGAHLTNAKFLPVIWLEVRFPTAGTVCVAPPPEELSGLEPGEAPELRESFLWVMPQQSIFWRQRAQAVRRGVCELRHMDLFSGDGFGLSDRRQSAQLRRGFRFIVYPEIRHVDAAPLLTRLSELERSRSGFYTDSTLINNIRDYRRGDSFRDINWRLLARQGTLQVNVHERMAMRRLCLMPDLASFGYTEVKETGGERRTVHCVHEAELERMLSVIASIIVEVNAQDVLCSLVIPSAGDTPARLITPEEREAQVTQLLTAIAEINYHGEDSFFPAADIAENSHMLGQLFLFSLSLPEGAAETEWDREGLRPLRVVQSGAEQAADGREIITERELTGV